MPTETTLALMRTERLRTYLASIESEMRLEAELEAAYRGEEDLTRLLPDRVVSTAWLERQRNGPNPFRRAIDRLVAPLTMAELQWSGDEGWEAVLISEIRKLEALVPFLALDLVLKGKAAILPWRDHAGEIRLSVLSGFLLPIWDDYEITRLERLLAVQVVQTLNGAEYQVWEIEPGVMHVYEGVRNLADYRRARKESYPQPHTSDLPVAFAVTVRDGNRAPDGYAEAALRAFKQYRQRLIQENASFELVGMPQRVVRGLEGDDTGTTKNFTPYGVIYLPQDAELLYPYPNHLEILSKARLEAAHQVALAAHSPDPTEGAGESGEARMIGLEPLHQASATIGNRIARLLEETSTLLCSLGVLPNPLTFSLQPEFAHARSAAQANITQMFQAGLISRYEALMRLQELGVNISPEEIEVALEEKEAMRPPKPVEPGTLEEALTSV